jgi:hypothetical protein
VHLLYAQGCSLVCCDPQPDAFAIMLRSEESGGLLLPEATRMAIISTVKQRPAHHIACDVRWAAYFPHT